MGCKNVQLGGAAGECLDKCPTDHYEVNSTVFVSFNSSDGALYDIEGILEEVEYRTCQPCHEACNQVRVRTSSKTQQKIFRFVINEIGQKSFR